MSYEHSHSIQFDLDHLSQYENVIELGEKKNELDEVYAKAEAFDEIVRCMEHQQAYGETDVMTIKDIDYVIWKYFKLKERSE